MISAASDLDLLTQWCAGSREAAALLFDRHFEMVHRFFRNKVGAESADLVQQTFLACIESRERYRAHASFKTYLLAIARHQLFAFYRERKRLALDVSVTSLRDLGTSPSGRLAQHEHEWLLAEALTRIPLESQVILELVYWEGLSGTDLACVLEVPINTATSKLRRARLALAAAMDKSTRVRGPAHALLERARSLELAPA